MLTDDDIPRSFTFTLAEYLDDEGVRAVESLMAFLKPTLDAHVADTAFLEDVLASSDPASRGRFREYVQKTHGKPYLSWDRTVGPRKQYYRMVLEPVRHHLLTVRERRQVSDICAVHGYDTSKMEDIRTDCAAARVYPTHGVIRNICKAGRPPSWPDSLRMDLDFAAVDDEVATRDYDPATGEVTFRWKMLGGTWVQCVVPVPRHVREQFDGTVTQPVIYRDGDSGVLKVRVCYHCAAEPVVPPADLCRMHVDLGRVSPFTGTVVWENSTDYSTMLVPSRETQNLNDQIRVLERELSRHYSKLDGIGGILTGVNDLYLAYHYYDVDEQAWLIRRKLQEQRSQLAWLVARDVVSHAKHHGADVISLENLSWLDATGGKWIHALFRERIEQVSQLNGIQVVFCDAKDTSHTDPFTGTPITPDRHRMSPTSRGRMDRDWTAGLEMDNRGVVRSSKIAKGGGRVKAMTKAQRQKYGKGTTPRRNITGKCRDKNAPTPKRPKRVSRKRLYAGSGNSQKSGAAVATPPAPNLTSSGTTIAVGSSVRASSALVQNTRSSANYTQQQSNGDLSSGSPRSC